MNLHANAALSLNARRRLVARVIDEGWSLTSAAAAAEVSDRTARKWGGPLARGWGGGPVGSVVSTAPSADSDTGGAGRRDRRATQRSDDRR